MVAATVVNFVIAILVSVILREAMEIKEVVLAEVVLPLEVALLPVVIMVAVVQEVHPVEVPSLRM